jgi:electron transfer flavoprotein beta subunit
MKIVVAVKQVPEISDVEVDPETGSLIRDGVSSILNPFCEYALDHAVKLKSALKDVHITALSMGPPQAARVLVRALELGADEGILVSDRKFAGADTWATALTLTAAIQKSIPDFNLIFVGKQAIDGDTAQVGPEMAEILHLPQICYGVGCEMVKNGRKIHVKKETDAGYQIIEARLPALVSFSKGEMIRRAPSFADIVCARQKPLKTLSASDLGIPDEDLGLMGSYTQVVKVFPPAARKQGRLMVHPDPDQAVEAILSLLESEKVFEKETTR